jgi:hypothetical protein
MTDPTPERPDVTRPTERLDRNDATLGRPTHQDNPPNPHDEEGSMETAARAGGAMTGMFLPAVIVAIVAIVVILYFVL